MTASQTIGASDSSAAAKLRPSFHNVGRYGVTTSHSPINPKHTAYATVRRRTVCERPRARDAGINSGNTLRTLNTYAPQYQRWCVATNWFTHQKILGRMN